MIARSPTPALTGGSKGRPVQGDCWAMYARLEESAQDEKWTRRKDPRLGRASTGVPVPGSQRSGYGQLGPFETKETRQTRGMLLDL